MPLDASPSLQIVACFVGVLVDRLVRGRRLCLADPGSEARGREVREDEREIPHVALGIEHERRDPGEERLLDQHDREARLPRAGHPDHDAMRRQVARADDHLVGAAFPVFGSIANPRWKEPRSAIVAESLESPRARRATSGTRIRRPDRRARHERQARPRGEGATEERLEKLVDRIDELQYRLGAEDRRSILLVLQGLDASGKDGVIRRVFDGVNPTGVRVTSFKVPVGAEAQHDYLWRIHAALPARGEIGVFNRSHYEDVVAVRMHQLAPEKVWRRRYEHLRAFERMLVDEGTTVVKVFLNVSRKVQRERSRSESTIRRSAGSSGATT